MRALAQPPTAQPKAAAGLVAAPQSATMDAFMRLMTGKEERTIADRISDPNRPTWEQYKRENADKLDLTDAGEKEMLAYRRKLDAAREKVRHAGGARSSAAVSRAALLGGGLTLGVAQALSKSSSSRKKKKRKSKKRSRSDSDSSGSDSDDDRRRSRKSKSRKAKCVARAATVTLAL